MMTRYSNEDFDVAQQIASMLTEADRRAGRDAPEFGYSSANVRRAVRIVRDAATAEDAYRTARGLVAAEASP